MIPLESQVLDNRVIKALESLASGAQTHLNTSRFLRANKILLAGFVTGQMLGEHLRKRLNESLISSKFPLFHPIPLLFFIDHNSVLSLHSFSPLYKLLTDLASCSQNPESGCFISHH